MLLVMQESSFRSNREPWQPWFDLHPPSFEDLAAVIAALDVVLTGAGFEHGPFGFDEPISELEPLYMRASWAREPLADDRDYVLDGGGIVSGLDGASVWGSGLIRLDVDRQSIELTFRDTRPETLAAMVAAHIRSVDAPFL
ncbi:hypothetical protein [Nocardia salmonicida]|uniref:hypothetical protein n=1 Tax=Nocardia salmonicida TaxID=53431 RepID=UPI0007A540EC|nr:hypothetical protein [Nocardia salmonicida]